MFARVNRVAGRTLARCQSSAADPAVSPASGSGISASFIKREERFGAHNYQPMPVVIKKGLGVHVWDVEGKQYYDFLSAYSGNSEMFYARFRRANPIIASPHHVPNDISKSKLNQLFSSRWILLSFQP